MTATAVSQPGLLYVNSGITSSKLSAEDFTKWYEGEHIPDILRTSGMNSAYRYHSVSMGSASVAKPYLAVYPLKDVSFLQTEEFAKIPVHSDLVPSESRCIFDVATFDVRYCINLGKEESQAAGSGPGTFLVSVQFNAPSNIQSSDTADVHKWYFSHENSSALRVRLYSVNFRTVEDAPQYLAFHEFNNESDAQAFVGRGSPTSSVTSFKLLNAFGDQEHNF